MAGRKATTQGKKKRGRRGVVGPQTYEQVLKLVAERKIPLVKAFDEVARATGRQVGTVSNTYYRIARLKKAGGGAVLPVVRRGRPPKSSISQVAQGPDALLARISADLQQLRMVVAQQAKALAQAQGDADFAARIRQALKS